VKVYGVVRISKGATNGASLKVQRATIEEAADREGWEVEWVEEVVTGTGRRARPDFEAALDALDRGDRKALVVSKLDRLARSLLGAAKLAERAAKNGWTIVSLDLGMGLDTPYGRFSFQQLSAVAELEAALISARTKDVLRAKRAEGKPVSGPVVPAAVVKRIKRAHRRGSSLATIARTLTRDGVPTARGGARWYPSTIRGVLKRTAAA
jgi:DNA invertase Pin-like site-specific DNA recombinase